MSAAHWKLDNLIADGRRQQPAGRRPVDAVMAFEPLVEKLQAFGWFVQRVDGNDLAAVVAAFDAARRIRKRSRASSSAIRAWARACRSSKQREKNHFIRVDAHEWQLALEALEAGRQA
jgi:transketolase